MQTGARRAEPGEGEGAANASAAAVEVEYPLLQADRGNWPHLDRLMPRHQGTGTGPGPGPGARRAGAAVAGGGAAEAGEVPHPASADRARRVPLVVTYRGDPAPHAARGGPGGDGKTFAGPTRTTRMTTTKKATLTLATRTRRETRGRLVAVGDDGEQG